MELNISILSKNHLSEENRTGKGDNLPLMEAFYTIQGEGFHQGKAAYFIRLGGCDVGCVWCDVKESWDESLYPLESVDAIAQKAANHPSRTVVITGGEPLLHPLDKLCKSLHEKGFSVHLETSGTHAISGKWDWICLSPKKFKAPLKEICQSADELKVVIFHKSDFAWAEKYAALVVPGCRLFLQPEWSRREQATPLIIEYVKSHPEWEISLQIHKYLGVP